MIKGYEARPHGAPPRAVPRRLGPWRGGPRRPGLPHQPARRLRAPAWTGSALWRPTRRASRAARPADCRGARGRALRAPGPRVAAHRRASGGRRARASGRPPHDRRQHDSRHPVLARDRRIVVARLAGPRWTRDLLIVRRAAAPLGPAAAAFRDLLLERR